MYYQDSIKFKLDDNYPKLEYQDRRHRPSSTLYVGQIKLFLTTLQFLTDYVPKCMINIIGAKHLTQMLVLLSLEFLDLIMDTHI
jgi:hypothetical protein